MLSPHKQLRLLYITYSSCQSVRHQRRVTDLLTSGSIWDISSDWWKSSVVVFPANVLGWLIVVRWGCTSCVMLVRVSLAESCLLTYRNYKFLCWYFLHGATERVEAAVSFFGCWLMALTMVTYRKSAGFQSMAEETLFEDEWVQIHAATINSQFGPLSSFHGRVAQ